MGKSMYNFGKQSKEKARQQKQIDKASKRLLAKQQKVNIKKHTPNVGSDNAEPGLAEETVKKTEGQSVNLDDVQGGLATENVIPR